ncbi:hypothetical protein CEXT_370391 [Caerostris extrusa]|uniref:Uncharacterized protein n=1 Tax=Caerostris extrusa TaxID=172846 RepID=A0AAV4NDI9_CAEEX|nr:hypothetical protein CEXT_370391 [Caerostris extrusa]
MFIISIQRINLLVQPGKAGRRCHLLGDVIPLKKQQAGMEEDDRRNVHHISWMLQSGRAGRRCHLLGDVIPLKKQRAGMQTTTEEMFIISI